MKPKDIWTWIAYAAFVTPVVICLAALACHWITGSP